MRSDPFDYLTILTSIVLGLAIANVLGRLAIVVTARERVNFYWPPIAWAIWLFFIAVQHWWAQWSVRHTEQWNLGIFWLQLLTPVDLFLLASLILPGREEAERLDLSEWFTRNRAWFYGLLFFLPIVSIVEEISRSGHMQSTLNLAFLLFFAAVSVLGYFLGSRRAQQWITGQAMVMTVVYVGVLFLALPQ